MQDYYNLQVEKRLFLKLDNGLVIFLKKKYLKDYSELLDDWNSVYQERINQLVFIGRNFNKEEMINKLNLCLTY